MANEHFNYKPYLKEAYIDPIRSVTVIDDEYPTLENLIVNGKSGYKTEDIERLEEIIKVSRGEFNWLLDVYDGNENALDLESVSTRLHYSDLLILDYHLDAEDEGVCQKSLDIIKKLATNRHFNIVAVHTKGYTGLKGTVNDVLCDIVLSFQGVPKKAEIHEHPKKIVEDAIADWSDDEPYIRNKLLDSIGVLETLYLIHKYEDAFFQGTLVHEMLDEFQELYNEKPEEVNLQKQLLIKWLASQKLSQHDVTPPESTPRHFEWDYCDGVNWIRTEDLFLTVLGKRTPVDEIPEKLLEAMENWRPHPHKLILSKLRSEVESKGISASSKILNKKHLQAAWLKELLDTKTDYESKTIAWSTVSKLWEELATEIKDDLGIFTIKLLNEIKQFEEQQTSALDYFNPGAGDSLQQAIHANCFSCSKKISSHHIITGHILEIENNYWLCLTPICDLVPGQKASSNDEPPLMPLTLVQMYDAKQALNSTREQMIKTLGLDESQFKKLTDEETLESILKYSTQNNLLFIRPEKANEASEQNIEIFSFTVGLDGKANPKAKKYFAKNQGIFDEDKTIELLLPEPCNKGTDIEVKPLKAKVIAELRYEYALNLLGRLGFASSRVGLDFVNAG